MRYFLILLYLILFLQNCYGNDDDPGSTAYCKSLGSLSKDGKCKKKDGLYDDYLLEARNRLFGAILRCSDRNSVKDLTGNCFNQRRTDIVKIGNESKDSFSTIDFTENKISKSKNLSIVSLCLAVPNVYDTKAATEQSFFQFDPNTNSAVQVLHFQDPERIENRDSISKRTDKFKNHIVPFTVNNLVNVKWIITFSGIIGECHARLPLGSGIFQNSQYQIIEVVE
jgi:hypothetical protein